MRFCLMLPVLATMACSGSEPTSCPPQEHDHPHDDQTDSGGETEPDDTAEPQDTGDTGEPEPEPEPACTFDGTAPFEDVQLVASHAVGSHRVAIGPSGALVVSHASDPTLSLFAPPVGAPWLTVADADLHAEEHQGSFDIEEGIGAPCTALSIDTAQARADTGDLLLTGHFEDCAAASFSVAICETGEEHLQLSVSMDDPQWDLISLQTESDAGESIFGLGIQALHDGLDLKGHEIPVISQEGGVGRGREPISAAVNAVSEGSAGSEYTAYYAAPHYLTSRNRSLLLEDTELAVFDFAADDRIGIRLHSDSLTMRVLHGDGPLALVESLTDWTGRMPVPPAWLNTGAVVALARPLSESLQIVDDLIAADAAISGVWNQTWSGTSETFIGEQVLWNWIQDPNTHPGWNDWVDELADRDIRTLCYINSMLRDVPEDHGTVRRNLYDEAIADGYFVKNPDGEPYLLEVTAFEVGLLDLANEDARTWYKDIIQTEMMDAAGCSGWMADFAEALPFDAVMADGQTGASWHNRYPVEWARLNREAVEEAGRIDDVWFFNRSGHLRSPGSAMTIWQGDQLTTWDRYDGLVSALHGQIAGGFSGVSLLHSDIGGYTSLSYVGLGFDREAEQLKRWTEMSAFTAMMRTHEGNQPGLNAQVYSSDSARQHFARMTRVYRALGDYRMGLFDEAATRGWPVVRHLAMHHPDDSQAWAVSDQFLLGADFLVAPIRNKCWTWPVCTYSKEVYLPDGVDWVHLWTGETFTGGQTVTVSAPLGEPAVFYRGDSTAGPDLVVALRADGFEI